ncbi:MAG: DUF6600 domain-containing protein [Candidatus Aminicenantales bacterium]
MKRYAAIVFSVAFLAIPVFSLPQEEIYGASYARLNYVSGNVYVQRAGDLGYEAGTVNLPIIEGDRLGTEEGRAEVHLGQSNYLRTDRYTQVDFVRLPREGDDTVRLHLLSGNIFLRVHTLFENQDYEVHTPDGSFYILEAGLYRFETQEAVGTTLYVMEGTVEAAGEKSSELVSSGETLVVARGSILSGPVPSYGAYEDSFSEWNRGREMFHNRYVRRSYLPSELYAYEAELAAHGRWVYEVPYGYVWVPYVAHYVWRPYYHGRWVWYPIIGWTWVSYEPWGWCVTHYGRWHWRLGLGWYWIPTRRWGPAWVHWYLGADYIGWCPLSYYGYPVVIINNRFYGRYYSRSYPAYSRALTVVRKDQLHAPEISKVALGPSSASRLGKISLSSKQPQVRPVVKARSMKARAAASVFSRSGVRPVTKVYKSGKAVRAPASQERGKGAISKSPGSLTQTIRRGELSSSAASGKIRTFSPSLSRTVSRSSGSKTMRGTYERRTKIHPYPSRGSSSSRSQSAGIKASVGKRLRASPSRRIPETLPRSRIRAYPSRSGASQKSLSVPRSRSLTSSPSARATRSVRSSVRKSPSRIPSTRSRFSLTTRIRSLSKSLSSSRTRSLSRTRSSPSKRFSSPRSISRSSPSRVSRSVSRSSRSAKVRKK